ncbi:MAG: hypothetical protein KatS3mg038_2975 [Candidatus Kapaibacterium sp.]|nr:MAG: hypothetical protein KatS3mg038_1869 [Candidatus Kapabacteria bacterium]GIV52454.1 MAG: hypothetical protein KatS3mg038_2975 [Candidatus Kapabacteria bacterium]
MSNCHDCNHCKHELMTLWKLATVVDYNLRELIRCLDKGYYNKNRRRRLLEVLDYLERHLSRVENGVLQRELRLLRAGEDELPKLMRELQEN